MYDALADIYDQFIDWPARLSRELPILTAWLGDARRVADAACGTGRHALALADAGYEVVGYDASPAALARATTAAAGRARFLEGRFGSLADGPEAGFDALLCLGNSLPHLLTPEAMQTALDDFAQLLVPGGRALLHWRNLALAATTAERWLPLRAETDPAGTERLFQRLYDFEPGGRVRFHFAIFEKPDGGAWSRRVESTQLQAWAPETLQAMFANWSQCELTGTLAGGPFDPATSGDLFIRAVR